MQSCLQFFRDRRNQIREAQKHVDPVDLEHWQGGKLLPGFRSKLGPLVGQRLKVTVKNSCGSRLRSWNNRNLNAWYYIFISESELVMTNITNCYTNTDGANT
jgi:hypothetical protein